MLARLLAFIAVIACAVSGCASLHIGISKPCAPDSSASTAALDNPAPHDLRVISWNLHGIPFVPPMDDRLANVSREVLGRKPDIVLFQEVWFDGDAALLEKSLERDYKRIADSPEITSSRFRFLAKFRLSGLLGFIRHESEWGIIGASTFDKYRAEGLLLTALIELDGISGKGIQRIEIGHRTSNRSLSLFNTHLQSPYPWNKYKRVRFEQIQELNKSASENRPSGRIQLAFGDFNTRPLETDRYGEMTKYWNDLTTKYRNECNCSTIVSGTAEKPDWIDYGLATKDSAVTASVDLIRNRSEDCPFSDHHGLDLRITLR